MTPEVSVDMDGGNGNMMMTMTIVIIMSELLLLILVVIGNDAEDVIDDDGWLSFRSHTVHGANINNSPHLKRVLSNCNEAARAQYIPSSKKYI